MFAKFVQIEKLGKEEPGCTKRPASEAESVREGERHWGRRRSERMVEMLPEAPHRRQTHVGGGGGATGGENKDIRFWIKEV